MNYENPVGSASSTPETDAVVIMLRQNESPVEIPVLLGHAMRMEAERDEWKAIATRLGQYVEPEIWHGVDAHDALEEFNHLSQNNNTTHTHNITL
jgi:hypothetical protein